MKIDINNALTIVIGLMTLAGAIYRLAQVEAGINGRIGKVENRLLLAIDQLRDKLVDRFHETEKKLDVHLTEYAEKKQFVEYRINDTDKKIEHKFNRLANWIKQIADHLGKESSFQIKDDRF